MSDLQPVFAALSSILRPYAATLDMKTDSPTELYVDTRHIMKSKKPLFFGAVQIRKNYVAFHFMPIYLQPALLDSVSPELLRHMQGKSCFNFTVTDEPLFGELAALVEAGYASYREEGYIRKH
ncbi:MAG: hypothetical protein EA350_08145 [Gemmatimonadales bacterium]|nr:MAG: hypothetical protein EA350_08145 [Gemmatimonadales bacterium]